jgi:hypothetical protein
MQQRLMRAFVKPDMANMLLALTNQRQTDQQQISALQHQLHQLQ